MSDEPVLRVLGRVSSPLTDRSQAPCQGDEGGPEAVVILDGKVPHSVLLELFTDHGAGTLIRRG